MGCCGGKKMKDIGIEGLRVVKKARNISIGFTNLLIGKNSDQIIRRLEICNTCEKTLWCSICKCFIPAKARVEDEKCPKNKWPII